MNIYADYIETKLDRSDTEARTKFVTLWDDFISKCQGLAVRTARRRALEEALCAAGIPIGISGYSKFAGGVQINGTVRRKKSWIATPEGRLRLVKPAINRERGVQEREATETVPAGNRDQ